MLEHLILLPPLDQAQGVVQHAVRREVVRVGPARDEDHRQVCGTSRKEVKQREVMMDRGVSNGVFQGGPAREEAGSKAPHGHDRSQDKRRKIWSHSPSE